MKLQDLLTPIILALLFSIGLQYFWAPQADQGGATEQNLGGRRVEIPRVFDPLMNKRLRTEVDFLDAAQAVQPVKSVITTQHAQYHFTTDGASLERLMFRRENKSDQTLDTIDTSDVIDRDDTAFLVALQDRTPYYYNLVSADETDHDHRIVYSAQTEDASIEKTFVINKDTYQLDLVVTIKPKAGKTIEPRIMFPAPAVVGLMDKDAASGVVFDQNKFTIITTKGIVPDSYWTRPTFFGGQDRYFVHALVKDADSFVQRAYFKPVDTKTYAVLEGQDVTQEKSWKVSFYCGPKQEQAMNLVDPRLTETLNYGMFGFITKYLAKWIRFALNYVYNYVHNYGIAIIVLTIFIKLVMLPFTYRAEQSMKQNAAMQKKLQYIEQKYKNDPQALAAAKTELITKHGMSGLSGCLTMLAQIPIFWGFSWVLSNAIELYQAPFLWISDLSAPDPLFILPICFMFAMMAQLTTAQTDAKQSFSSFAMALVVGAFLSYMPAGLTLYILGGTVLAVVQNMITKNIQL